MLGRRPLVVIFAALILVVLLVGKADDNPKYNEEKNICLSGVVEKISTTKDGRCLWMDTEEYGKITVYVSDETGENVGVGNTVKVCGDIYPYESAANDGGFDSKKYYYYTYRVSCRMYADKVDVIEDDVFILRNALYNFRCSLCRMTEKVYDNKDAPVVKAMLFGDKSSLEKEVKESYQTGGIGHILAISGLHVSIIGMLFYGLLYKITSSVKMATVTTIIMIFMYGLLTGFSVSTNRAVVMMIIMMMAKMLGRTYDMASAICLSGIIVIVINPYQLYLTGALLSFLAVTAVCALLPAIFYVTGFSPDDVTDMKMRKLRGNYAAVHRMYPFCTYIYRGAVKALGASFAISLVTLPVILYNYYEFNPLSVIGNIIVIPLMTIVVTMALVSVLLAYLNVSVGVFFSGCVHYILKLYEFICRLCDGRVLKSFLTGRPDAGRIVLYYIVIALIVIAFALLKYKFEVKIPILFIAMLAGSIFIFRPVNDGHLHVDMLDVGQGDGIVVRTAMGKTILFDGGSSSKDDVGKDIIEKYLKYHGIRNIDYAIVSHPDKDHISGLEQIIEREKCKIGCLILPGIGINDDGYENLRLLALNNDITVKYLNCGMTFEPENGLIFTALHPDNDYVCEDRNDYSLTLLLKYMDFSMIFTGDISVAQEDIIADYAKNTGINLDVDVYKCAHHGSAGSSGEQFLDLLKPEYTIISAGKNNMYHHPSDKTLKRLDDAGSRAFVTFNTGQISIVSDGRKDGLKIRFGGNGEKNNTGY